MRPPASMSSRRPGARATLAATGLYLLLAVAATWPLATNLSLDLPLGTLDSETLPLVSTWTLWWTADRLPALFDGYWDAPIFHPTPATLARQEPMVLPGVLAAPLFWLGVSPIAIYGLTILAALATNGLVPFALLRRLRLPRGVALLGGAFVVLLPYPHRELGVLTLVPLAGLVASIWMLLRFARSPSPLRGAALGAACGCTYLICGQHALFLGLAVLPASPWLLRRRLFASRTLISAAVAVAVAIALVLPVALAQLEHLGGEDLLRVRATASAGSASVRSWLAPPWRPVVPLPGAPAPVGPLRRGHYPGTVKLALATVGTLWGLGRGHRRRSTGFLATMAFAALVLSVAPRVPFGDFALYGTLVRWVPGLSQVRAFYRAAVLVQIGVALLAAQGLYGAWFLLRKGVPALGRRPAFLPLTAVGLLALIELWPRQQGFAKVAVLDDWHPVAAWLRTETEPQEAVAFLPVIRGRQARVFADDGRWMLLQTRHGRPIANGYSSYIPQSRRDLANGTQAFPDAESHRTLEALDVTYAVVREDRLPTHRSEVPDPRLWRPVARFPELAVSVYRVLHPLPWEAQDDVSP